MNLLNFGREQLQKGMLNSMLEQVGIDDVGSFVKEFRNEANHEAAIATQEHQNEDENEDEDEDTTVRHASNQQANLFSKGSSLLNQVWEQFHFYSRMTHLFSSPVIEEVIVVVVTQWI